MSTVTTYTRTSKSPIPYGVLHPGSMFTIHAEKSRGLLYSRDSTIYKRAVDGFYSYDLADQTRAAVLYPEDLVWPVVRKRT